MSEAAFLKRRETLRSYEWSTEDGTFIVPDDEEFVTISHRDGARYVVTKHVEWYQDA